VFFYYAKITAPSSLPAAGGTLTVNVIQFNTSNSVPHPANLPNFAVQQNQVFAFNDGCIKLTTGSADKQNAGNANITINNVKPNQVIVISVKYDVKTIVGKTVNDIVGPDYQAYFISKVNGVIDNTTAGNIRVYNCSATPAPTTTARVTSETTETTVTAYPNPYNDQVRFNILSPVSGTALLEAYDLLGRRMAVIYQGSVQAGISRTITYRIPAIQRVAMIYRLRVGDHVINGKLFPNGGIHY